ncbi:MAG: sel1 repeat family protein [Alphaproteobacteria bacterium]|nr:sel1 repeat family protein [Alphaproteobacteria bacterium]
MKKFLLYATCCSMLLWNVSAQAGLLDAKLSLQYQQYPAALAEFNVLAEQGSPAALYYLGYMHQGGLGVPVNLATAYNYYKRADEAFYLPAAAPLGAMLLKGGAGVPTSYSSAIHLLKKAALSGSASAAYELGMIHLNGLGKGTAHAVPENFNHAFGYFLLGALRGDRRAQQQLSKMYLVGRGVPQDYQKSLAWLTRAANQGYPKAQLELATLLESDPRLKNPSLAYAWYALLAAYGEQELGVMAATKRDALAKNLSAQEIAQRQKEVQQWRRKLPEETVPEAERAADQLPIIQGFNDPNTLQQIISTEGILPMDGKQFGVTQEMLDTSQATQDFTQVEMNIEKSMKRGLIRAGAYYADILRRYFHNDIGAFKWYQKSAEAGDAYAQYQLAKAYCEGRGVEPDASECYAWLLTVQNAQNPTLNALVQQALAAVNSNATPLELERGREKMNGRIHKEAEEKKSSGILDFL